MSNVKPPPSNYEPFSGHFQAYLKRVVDAGEQVEAEPDYKLAFEAARGQIESLLRMGRDGGGQHRPAFREIDTLWSGSMPLDTKEAAAALLRSRR